MWFNLPKSKELLRAEENAMFSVICIIILVGLLALVGSMSKTDNDMDQSFYCQSVHDGVQPDYNWTYKQGKCPQSEGTVRK